MARKPKPIEVGHVGCPFHSEHSQAKVKKSLVTNKLFIDCPKCGLIMPTLANFQEWIKENAEFNADFERVYIGDDVAAGGSENNGGRLETSKPETQQADKAEEEAPQHAETKPPEKPQPVKNSFDQEMGF